MIGILSDSHDNRDAVRAAVDLFNRTGCRLVLHAGDFVAPFAAGELAGLACPVKAVFGNCDGEKGGLTRVLEPIGEIGDPPLEFPYAGRRFLLMHTQFSIPAILRAKRCDILVYGHTHRPEIRREGGVLIVNPGEAGGWVTGKSTVALLDPEAETAEIIPL